MMNSNYLFINEIYNFLYILIYFIYIYMYFIYSNILILIMYKIREIKHSLIEILLNKNTIIYK